MDTSPLSPGSLLIDNSTYFSANAAIQTGEIDADNVFNLGNFLSSIVLSEKVYLAPTTQWEPNREERDGLFSSNGPCAQFPAFDLPRDYLDLVFTSAIDATILDLATPRMARTCPFAATPDDIRRAIKQLERLKVNVHDDPKGFLGEYSKIVEWGDHSANKFLRGLTRTRRRSKDNCRQLLQYFLRSNVAIQLSREVPYQPHSKRVAFSKEKLALSNTVETRTAAAVAMEDHIRRELRSISGRELRTQRGMLMQVEQQLVVPLVFYVLLSGARSPEGLVENALTLRASREVVLYRKWLSKLSMAMNSETLGGLSQAIVNLKEAQIHLTEELQRLFGRRPSSIDAAWSRVMHGVLSATSLMFALWRGENADIARP